MSGLLLALKEQAFRIGVRGSARAHGRLLGWPGSSVPLSSRIIGRDRITVGASFDAAEPVWIEAVERFGGQSFAPRITIGSHFTTSGNTHIAAIDAVSIGDGCLLGRNVLIIDHSHGDYTASGPSTDLPPRERPLVSGGPIRIGDRCWIGDNATILGGVTVGDGAVIGAGAVVTKSVAAGTVVAGVPAVAVKRWIPGSGWVSVSR
jgi:acetyltransferase-like isoleucine patch superfamily enzyme